MYLQNTQFLDAKAYQKNRIIIGKPRYNRNLNGYKVNVLNKLSYETPLLPGDVNRCLPI